MYDFVRIICDHRSIYRLAANITIDIPIENDINMRILWSKSVHWLSDPSPIAKNKNWKQLTKLKNKTTKAPIM